ncbi:hypothetical protein FBQ96_02830 [Nitrospirales bacterium NOB]|nr:hypothetical protein [Nitrospirota bacterium]MCE7965709.1 hypothetical protein [Nitrospira sp. NTP2]MCK6493099.1 hypothetical protein [Nitrospira sp.]MDL1888513.1 hypothetical protein [Nitrospirales bacterium NOB]MEB2338541.1 hypothetical protein [Nitrospirales bacterium]
MGHHIAGIVSRAKDSVEAEAMEGRASVDRCPVRSCEGRLTVDARAYDARTGLDTVVCPSCGHRGFKSREGVLLLFRCGSDYQFSYGPSVKTITVALSSAAVNLWSTHGVSADQLAKMAAEWGLVCGRPSQRVRLRISEPDFADCYLYFCRA